jgi:hypothetical protein
MRSRIDGGPQQFQPDVKYDRKPRSGHINRSAAVG